MKIKSSLLITSIALCAAAFLGIKSIQLTNLVNTTTDHLHGLQNTVNSLEKKIKQSQGELSQQKEIVDQLKAEKVATESKKDDSVEKNQNPIVESAVDSIESKEDINQQLIPEKSEETYINPQLVEAPTVTDEPTVVTEPNWGEQFKNPNLTGAERSQLGKEKGEYYRNKYGH